MTIADADSAVTQFVVMMERVHAMIIARRNPGEVKTLLCEARRLLDRAETAVREVASREHNGLRDALPHLHWKLVQLEQVAKLGDH
jgi:hypothetical protein